MSWDLGSEICWLSSSLATGSNNCGRFFHYFGPDHGPKHLYINGPESYHKHSTLDAAIWDHPTFKLMREIHTSRKPFIVWKWSNRILSDKRSGLFQFEIVWVIVNLQRTTDNKLTIKFQTRAKLEYSKVVERLKFIQWYLCNKIHSGG